MLSIFAHSLTHSLTRPLGNILITHAHLLPHPLNHSLTYPPIRTLTRILTHSLTHTPTHTRPLTQGVEYTRVGVRDGSYLPGVDLWDEINGDFRSFNASTPGDCMAKCLADDMCTAWTFTPQVSE